MMRNEEATVNVSELAQCCGAGPVQLVDVRSPGEFASGHVPGAVNIPMEQVESRLGDLREGCRVVLICQSGSRARTVAEWLRAARPDVVCLEGGTAAWLRAGQPVVQSVNSRWSLERQVRLGAGVLMLIGVALGLGVSRGWLTLSVLAGLGLTMAGLTGFCPMAVMLARLPWNRVRQPGTGSAAGAGTAAGSGPGCSAA